MQVYRVAASLARHLSHVCIYGGVPYDKQERALSQGVDLVVGTPGRVIDHLQRGTLSLSSLRHLVLDEADEMLNMGFRDAMEDIMRALPPAPAQVQKLLYSATMPHWVAVVARDYLQPDHVLVDLVGSGQRVNQGAAKVRHLAMRTTWQGRLTALADVVRVYGRVGGKTMFFCNTKQEANEVALSSTISSDCQVPPPPPHGPPDPPGAAW